MPKQTVLVVDDVKLNRAFLVSLLEDEYNLLEAENGSEALEILKENENVAAVLLDIVMPVMDGYAVLKALYEKRNERAIPILVITANDDLETQVKTFELGAADVITKPFNPSIVKKRVKNLIELHQSYRVAEQNHFYKELIKVQEENLRLADLDEKTGLYNKKGFVRRVEQLLRENADKRYCIICWEIGKLRVYNDVFGLAAGDSLLRFVGDAYLSGRISNSIASHFSLDHFVCCAERQFCEPENRANDLFALFAEKCPGFELGLRMGFYSIDDPTIDVELMCDRAFMALNSIARGSGERWAWYDESMRNSLLEEQEIIGDAETALSGDQFEIYLQPQYNYDKTQKLIGAEALVRWRHPKKGLLLPAKFIPILEYNGLISLLDRHVWEKVCKLLRSLLDEGGVVVPISINISRYDFYSPDLCDFLGSLVDKYELPRYLLHLEITESAYMNEPELIIKAVERLQEYGFVVEMDDFGSGYSSLNTLKDLSVDMLKLDKNFVAESTDSDRGGSILNSVIRMAHWLKLPVLAEGVETKKQADYLKTLNCVYMQGYYFCKPVDVPEFKRILKNSVTGAADRYKDVNIEGIAEFWNPSAQIALLFNSVIGGSAICEYRDGNLELLRANDNFYREIRVSREDYMLRDTHCLDDFDEVNRKIFVDMLARADGGEEASCFVRHRIVPGEQKNWIHCRCRMLASNSDSVLYYVEVANCSEQKLMEDKLRSENESNRLIVETLNICIFDYNVAEQALSLKTTIQDKGVTSCKILDYCSFVKKDARIHPNDRKKVVDIIKRAASSPQKGLLEFRGDMWGNGMRPCQTRYASVAGEGGKVEHIVGYICDLSEYK